MSHHRGRGICAGIVLAGLCGAPSAQVGHVVKAHKISQTSGGFGGILDPQDQFGRSIVNLGDLNGDGIGDLLVGSHTDDDGPDAGQDRGSVWILFLAANGYVSSQVKISEGNGGFSGWLDPGDQFGRAAARIGDLDGDGLPEVAVSANYDDDGGTNKGAIYVLFLQPDGNVRQVQKISELSGNLGVALDIHDEFGRSIAPLGDLDGDGIPDLLVGAPLDDEGGTQIGGAYVLFLNADGTVKTHTKMDKTSAGLRLKPGDWFGFSGTLLGDLDGDGLPEVAVGAILDDDGGFNQGAVWILGLNADGTLRHQYEINELSAGLPLDDVDHFGTSVAGIGDLDGDGVPDLAVGAVKDDDGGTDSESNVGAVYVLFLNADGSVKAWNKVSETQGNLNQQLDAGDWFGSALAFLGPSIDGSFNLAIGARYDNDGGGNQGAIYLVQLNDGTAPVVDFQASRTYGVAPMTVSFTDGTQGDVTGWLWHFSDGPSTTEQNPVHTFDLPGSYEIQLSAKGPSGTDFEVRSDFVVVIDGVLAGFEATPRTGPAPLSVSFQDASEGQVTSWGWDFGDGQTSDEAAPVHLYAAQGSYDVTLTIAGPLGTHALSLPNFVEVLAPVPMAAFSADPAQGAVPLPVAFQDQSIGVVTSWAWDFGDGQISTDQNPTHVYEAEGTYTVALIANGPGGADLETRVDLIVAEILAPIAGFTAAPLSGPAPLLVAFDDVSSGASAWTWDFGDGYTSTEADPEHIYLAQGTYSVTLTASGPGGSDVLVLTELVTVGLPLPEVAFSVTGGSGLGPVHAQFTNQSGTDVTTWSWDFGDGETSDEENPSHDYEQPGSYTVTLTVHGPGGINTVSQHDVVVVAWPAPAADFLRDVTGGPAPVAVQFQDTSLGNVSAWSWSFGDGQVSAEPSPAHTYTAPGTYSVSLTVNGPGGSDAITLPDAVIVATPAPTAEFAAGPPVGFAPLPVSFSDLSLGDITSWSWDFGDGTASIQRFPVKTFAAPGIYSVRLTVQGPGGTSTIVHDSVEVLRLAALRDDGFERQTPGEMPGNGWVPQGTGALVHPLTFAQDGAMPSDGSQWCEVNAEGTTMATPPSNPGGGGSAPAGAHALKQAFRFSALAPRLSFEAAFLSGEPLESIATNDFMSVELSDGTTTWNVFYADTFSILSEVSSVYGLVMTQAETVQVDLRTIFPVATEGQVLTLCVSVGNVGDDLNPSRGYVDGFRFAPLAMATVRNGKGVNAMRYVSSPAVLGGQWNVTVDTTGHPNARRVQIMGTLRPSSGVMRAAGEILVSGPKIVNEIWTTTNDIEQRTFTLPLDASLLGRTLNTQAIVFGGATEFCNAYDLVLGF